MKEKKERYKSKLAVYLVLLNNEDPVKGTRLLMHKRHPKSEFSPDLFCLVSGHVEEGEKVSDALFRESLEEANIIPVFIELRHVCYRRQQGYTVMDFYFVAESYRGEIKNNEPDKCTELRWVDSKKLPPDTIPYIREALKCIEEGTPFSQYGWD